MRLGHARPPCEHRDRRAECESHAPCGNPCLGGCATPCPRRQSRRGSHRQVPHDEERSERTGASPQRGGARQREDARAERHGHGQTRRVGLRPGQCLRVIEPDEAQADQRDESDYTTEALERDCDRRCDGRRLTAELTYKWCGHYGRAKRAENRRVSIAGHPSCTVTSALDQSRYPAFLTTTL